MKAWSVTTLLALIAVCAVNIVATVQRIAPPPRIVPAVPANEVMRHELRMAELRRTLEQRGVRGTIGYLADMSAAELPANARGMEEYFLTQFALVPWVLDARAQEGEWVVANLRTARITERAPAGLQVMDDCGGGVFLLRRTERPVP
jgi:hypothetical protein